MLEMVILLVLLRTAMGGLSETNLWPSLMKMSLATLGMAAVLLGIGPLLPIAPSWLGGIVGIVVGGSIYLGLAYIIGVDELKPIQQKVIGFIGSRFK